MSLNNLSIELSGLGRSAEAVVTAQEAVLRYRQLADNNPATYGPDLARALSAIAQIRVTSRSELLRRLRRSGNPLRHTGS